MDDRVGGDNAVRRGIGLHHLEFNWVHSRPHQEEIPLLDGTVSLKEVWLEVYVEKVARHALNSVVQREDMNTFSVWNVAAIRDAYNVRKSHAEVLAHYLVHPHAGVVAGFVGEHDADCVTSLLSLDENSVAAKKGELFHLGGGEGDDGIVVVRGIVDEEAIGGALFAKDSILHVGVFIFGFHHFGEGMLIVLMSSLVDSTAALRFRCLGVNAMSAEVIQSVMLLAFRRRWQRGMGM
mmetsp:Transcript_35199/g.74263  ORF Transcript_35199/g.74263 Transcript_35199/m.74263 type:complete len:236 (-) Transcript_35199:20-727(-)